MIYYIGENYKYPNTKQIFQLKSVSENGLTLCINCHGKVHNTNFGIRTRKNKQL
mgnify:CR=1 FL=1